MTGRTIAIASKRPRSRESRRGSTLQYAPRARFLSNRFHTTTKRYVGPSSREELADILKMRVLCFSTFGQRIVCR